MMIKAVVSENPKRLFFDDTENRWQRKFDDEGKSDDKGNPMTKEIR